jgi:hypothetical protein
MLAIDTASTYPDIQLLYTGLMPPGKICYKVYQLAMIDPCIADSPENLLHPFKETYSCDVYHEGDITLVTLGSVLACFLCKRGAVFLT